MILYNNKNYEKQIKTDYKDLENYKNSYNKRISLYNIYLDTMQVFEAGIIETYKIKKEKLENKIKIFQIQINKIDNNLEFLNDLLKNIDTNGKLNVEKKALNKYNRKYSEICNNYINNSVCEEQITMDYINGLMTNFAKKIEKTKEEHEIEMEKILNENSYLKNNNTLLISEKLGKIILPYRAEEVLEIFNNENNKYVSLEEVIEDKFTRNFSEFKIQFASRYNETIKLARERENYNIADSILLAMEMMRKRYLHPAIIAACKNLNELDVYLDCLDKNELEEFKIFKIKYELYPMIGKHNKGKKGTRYKETSRLNICESIKNMFKSNNYKKLFE